jgi:hypothetical protein
VAIATLQQISAWPFEPYLFYVGSWILACALAGWFVARDRSGYGIRSVAYWRLFTRTWKWATFIPAIIGLSVMAPYTGDPTWDWVDAGFMSLLTFLTAPWSVATFYRALRGRAGASRVYVAICLTLFSASWSYDAYILLRDGIFPPTWASNMVVSSAVYLCAGMFWNLEWRTESGAGFSFTRETWPAGVPERFSPRALAYLAMFMVPITMLFGYFLWVTLL